MKKSTNESPLNTKRTPPPKATWESTVWEMFTMEGGLSLLIVFPLVVLYFLKRAYFSFN